MFDVEFRIWWLVLAGLLAAPLVSWLAIRPRATVTYSSLALLDRVPRSWRSRLAILPAVLLGLAMLSFFVALAGPRTPDDQTRISREGIAIMMIIDRSSSMNARDLVQDDTSVDRLTVVKDVFERFVLGQGAGKGRPDDMIGLITFAGYADSICPLTMDHFNLTALVKQQEIVNVQSEDGTAIGDGLALAVERLRKSKAKSKVAIVLTDGVHNAGQITPTQAAELAAEHDIKVYCIGAGTNGMAPVPVRDLFTGRIVLRAAQVQIDEETLQDIADKTGGQYFRATDADTLTDVYKQIDQLERTEITEFRYLRYTEHYGGFVLTGMLLACVATITGGTLFRRLP